MLVFRILDILDLYVLLILLSRILRWLNQKVNIAPVYSSVLIITLEFKVVFIRAGLNKLLARKTDHELSLLILNDSFRLLIFLLFLGVCDIDPICVILLLVIRIDDYLLR